MMEIHLKLILTTFFVSSGWTWDQNIYQNLFTPVAQNYQNKGQSYKQLLMQDSKKAQETFKNMQSELRTAQWRNSYSHKVRSSRRSNAGEDITAYYKRKRNAPIIEDLMTRYHQAPNETEKLKIFNETLLKLNDSHIQLNDSHIQLNDSHIQLNESKAEVIYIKNREFVVTCARHLRTIVRYLEETYMEWEFITNHLYADTAMEILIQKKLNNIMEKARVKRPDLLQRLSKNEALIRSHWKRLYIKNRRYKFELFIEWTTENDYSVWQNDTEPAVVNFVKHLKEAFKRGSGSKMKDLFLDCVAQQFTDATEDVKQYANSFDERNELLKQVGDIYQQLLEIEIALTTKQDEFIEKNQKSLAVYCTQLLNKKFFPEPTSKEDPNKFKIKDWNEEREVMTRAQHEEYVFKEICTMV